jgi:hypothetical protein
MLTKNINLEFAGIIPPQQLPAFAGAFDVGLALETGFSENNNIALSNKIFTYMLAGNAIILSETLMQNEFNKTFKIGQSFPIGDADKLAEKIKFYMNKSELMKQKQWNYNLAATTFNWETESKKMLLCLQQV